MQKNYYVNGEWKTAKKYTDLFTPYSHQLIAQIPELSIEDAEYAIDVAYEAREQMAMLTAYERAAILEELAALFQQNKQKAVEIIASEAGKPLKFALGEIDRTIETYKFAAEEAKRLSGEMIPMDAAKNGANRLGYTITEPIGVVGAITPFNFPQNLVAHKVGPAIAAGNTVVLKPAEQTPLSALFLAELLDRTSLPKGAFNVITGDGRVVGNALVESEKVEMITFTGSPAVGIGIRSKAGLKKVTLELGSNSGLIIDRGVDVKKIVPKCVTGAFSNQGQICISLQRIYVMDEIYDEFLEAFIKTTENLVVGDPLDETTDISAMIKSSEQERALEWIEEAVEHGAVLKAGGKVEDGVLLPTVLANVDPVLKIACREAFAPVVVVNKISSIEEGIASINDSDYGLQAGVFTNNIEHAFQAVKKLEVGGVIINDIPTYRVDQMPYGGVKQSGIGKEGLKYAIEEMTEKKLVIWNQEMY